MLGMVRAIKLFPGRKLLSFLFSKSAQLTLPRFLWLILIVLLAACGTLPPKQAGRVARTGTSTFTPDPQTPTALPTSTFALTPSPGPLPLFPLDGYVMVFIKDGDLYFQEGNNSPVKCNACRREILLSQTFG